MVELIEDHQKQDVYFENIKKFFADKGSVRSKVVGKILTCITNNLKIHTVVGGVAPQQCPFFSNKAVAHVFSTTKT